MSTRKLVIVPGTFTGPWSAQFSCPLRVFGPDNENWLAVLVTDPNTTMPPDAKVFEIGPTDTLAKVLEQAGVRRTPAVVIPPQVVIVPPPVMPTPVKPTFLSRVKSLFKLGGI